MYIRKKDLVKLTPHGLWADRETLQETFDYAEMIAKASESPIHAIAPWFVLFNTIANKYYLVPKEAIDNE